MLESEREHHHLHAVVQAGHGEQVAQAVAQRTRTQIAGVNDGIRNVAHRSQKAALYGDTLRKRHARIRAERMAATAEFVPGDDGLVRSIQEDDAIAQMRFLQMVQLVHELRVERLVAGIAYHGKPAVLLRLPWDGGQADEIHQKTRRQVVDAKIAQVLERVHGLCAARAAHARDDDQVGCGILRALFLRNGFVPFVDGCLKFAFHLFIA